MGVSMSAIEVEIFGALAASTMVICYAAEERNPRFILGFAVACLASSASAHLSQSWPFAVIEFIWAGLALRRWRRTPFLFSRSPHFLQDES